MHPDHKRTVYRPIPDRSNATRPCHPAHPSGLYDTVWPKDKHMWSIFIKK